MQQARNDSLRAFIDGVYIDSVRYQPNGYNITDSVLASYYILKTFRAMEGR
jgi:hypothetical protein